MEIPSSRPLPLSAAEALGRAKAHLQHAYLEIVEAARSVPEMGELGELAGNVEDARLEIDRLLVPGED